MVPLGGHNTLFRDKAGALWSTIWYGSSHHVPTLDKPYVQVPSIVRMGVVDGKLVALLPAAMHRSPKTDDDQGSAAATDSTVLSKPPKVLGLAPLQSLPSGPLGAPMQSHGGHRSTQPPLWKMQRGKEGQRQGWQER